MFHPLSTISRLKSRNILYFSTLKNDIKEDNFFVLQKSLIIFEICLILYGIFAYFSFQSILLDILYLFFLVFNSIFLYIIRKIAKQDLEYKKIQALCILFLIQVFAFNICVGIFPFPDRPAIFFTPIYILLISLFQFRFWTITSLFTSMSVLFIFMAVMFKTINAYVYDITGTITSWLLGSFIVLVMMNLRLRNGEVKIELERMSQTDFLTGLPNRREMEKHFSLIYNQCIEEKLPVAVFMLDIDFFKNYNDQFGHMAGDMCLVGVGQVLSNFVKDTGYFAARFGGEEFAIILPGCTTKMAKKYANHLLEMLRFKKPDGENGSFSMGIAIEIPQLKNHYEKLLKHADEALYQAKEQGRNQYVIYEYLS